MSIMIRTIKARIAGLFAVFLIATMGGTAHAAIIDYNFSGAVTANAEGALNGIIDIGDVLGFTLSLDADNPDADPLFNSYQSSNLSDLGAFIVLPLTGEAGVSTSGTTNWSASGMVSAQVGPTLVEVPMLITLAGMGMTADQILPDFSSFSGTYSADLTSLAGELPEPVADPFVRGSIDFINGVAATSPVPVAPTLPLMGLGMAVLLLTRRKARQS